MKKFLLAFFMIIASVAMYNNVNARIVTSKSGGGGSIYKIPASQVPRAVRISFKTQYPSATQVEWEYKPVYYGQPVYTASFHLGTQKWEANYYADGTFISAYPKA